MKREKVLSIIENMVGTELYKKFPPIVTGIISEFADKVSNGDFKVDDKAIENEDQLIVCLYHYWMTVYPSLEQLQESLLSLYPQGSQIELGNRVIWRSDL